MIPQGLDSFSTPGKFIPVLFITFSDGVYVLDLVDDPCARRGSMRTHGIGEDRVAIPASPTSPANVPREKTFHNGSAPRSVWAQATTHPRPHYTGQWIVSEHSF